MEGQENNNVNNGHERDEVFSKAVRAGKRTYFFDVKSTRANDYYLTITESKRRFNNETQKFFFEKHKLFLYKEDFEKFKEGLFATIYLSPKDYHRVHMPIDGKLSHMV